MSIQPPFSYVASQQQPAAGADYVEMQPRTTGDSQTFAIHVPDYPREVTPPAWVSREQEEANRDVPVAAPTEAPASAETAEKAGGAAADGEGEEVPIDVLVDRAIIHANKPIEHLPYISPPELKLIGRCVTFRGETAINGEPRFFFYEGLVGTINKDTVMLIHVHRYTEEDFQIHRLASREQTEEAKDGQPEKPQAPSEERHVERCGSGFGDTPEVGGSSANGAAVIATEPSFPSPGRREGTDGSDEFAGINAADPSKHPPTGEAGNHFEEVARIRNRMKGHDGSMGPIPFVTFSRSQIHRVEFGTDPRSSFYSLFLDPSKEHLDMQYLRMFARRYLIHTSQGNNPRKVPLRAFITCRCHCPDLDNDLLVRVTKEELAHLIKIDREVKRQKKKKDQTRRNVLRGYRAPPGVFVNTGVLYLTHLPRQTFTLAVSELVMSLAIAVYTAVSTTTSERYVVGPYVMKLFPFVLSLLAVGMICAGATLIHSTRMSVPFRQHTTIMAARALFSVGAAACSVMTLIVASEMFSLQKLFSYFYREVPIYSMCSFYEEAGCSGFYASCGGGASAWECLCYENATDHPQGSCRGIMAALVERAVIPIICLSLVSAVLFIFDLYMHYKTVYVSRLLERRM